MNERHLQICASAEWAQTIEHEILPWALGGRELGDDVLEVGPGPGQTTHVLRHMVPRLTAVEIDEVPSPEAQDRLLRELRRVLRPGGLCIGVDSIDHPDWRELHAGDICVPVDPDGLPRRLSDAGFADVEVETRPAPDVPDGPARRFRFAARAP